MELSGYISNIEHLPSDVQKQLVEYIEFLLSKYSKKPKRSNKAFKFDWEGGLKNLKHKYSSVELQHLTNDLR